MIRAHSNFDQRAKRSIGSHNFFFSFNLLSLNHNLIPFPIPPDFPPTLPRPPKKQLKSNFFYFTFFFVKFLLCTRTVYLQLYSSFWKKKKKINLNVMNSGIEFLFECTLSAMNDVGNAEEFQKNHKARQGTCEFLAHAGTTMRKWKTSGCSGVSESRGEPT